MSFREKMVLNLLVWLCVFPSVLVFSYAFRWLGLDLAYWVEIMISTAVSVPFISTICIPRIEAALAKAEGETPAELKMRQAEEAPGPDPDRPNDGRQTLEHEAG